jgi:hypothetical protein
MVDDHQQLRQRRVDEGFVQVGLDRAQLDRMAHCRRHSDDGDLR